VAVVILLVGAVMMMDARRIGIGWASDGPKGGYFPFRTGAILAIASMVILLRTLFGKRRNHELFVSWDRFKMVLAVLLPTVLYVLAIQFIGIYIASAVFIGGFMRAIGRFEWPKVMVISIVTSIVLFWMFEIQFMTPLPKGPLESMLGY
jgi:putative tricarboxylic transport membrane protein